MWVSSRAWESEQVWIGYPDCSLFIVGLLFSLLLHGSWVFVVVVVVALNRPPSDTGRCYVDKT